MVKHIQTIRRQIRNELFEGLISSIIVSDLQSNDYFLLKYVKKRCW